MYITEIEYQYDYMYKRLINLCLVHCSVCL